MMPSRLVSVRLRSRTIFKLPRRNCLPQVVASHCTTSTMTGWPSFAYWVEYIFRQDSKRSMHNEHSRMGDVIRTVDTALFEIDIMTKPGGFLGLHKHRKHSQRYSSRLAIPPCPHTVAEFGLTYKQFEFISRGAYGLR